MNARAKKGATPKKGRGRKSDRSELDVLVVGGGTFGTALGLLLTEVGHRVCMWMRNKDKVDEINNQHTNHRYLPDIQLPDKLRATTDLQAAIKGTPIVLMVVPSRGFREAARAVGDAIEGDQILVHATKGMEIDSFKRMSEILREETCSLKIGVISGPNLAREIMLGHPAGALVASRYDEVDAAIQALFSGCRLRMYSGRDVIGTEIGGSFKNIIAIATGAADGMGFMDNVKSLLVTRGLSEMARFGVALGADVFTFGGLAGIGDLMATCSSPLSRNHQVGERIGKGEKLKDILDSMTQVAEGVPTTKAVHQQAQALGLELPIVRAVHGMLYENWSGGDAKEALMSVPVGQELATLRFR
jgi:glycerol-3-phosphate dehydrogenase (NAD(P)+)